MINFESNFLASFFSEVHLFFFQCPTDDIDDITVVVIAANKHPFAIAFQKKNNKNDELGN